MSLVSLVNKFGLSKGSTKPHAIGSIPLTRDPYAPTYKIIHRGGEGAQPTELTSEITDLIDEVMYEDNANQLSRFSITFQGQADNAGGGQYMSLIDSKLFSEGSILEFQFGYGGSLRTVGAGIITKKQPDFPESDFPSFTIEGHDLLYKAVRRIPKDGVSYKGFRDSQIVSIIGERNGFDIKTTDPRSFEGIRKTQGIFDRVQKKGVSDYQFLKKVAEINGFEIFSRFDTKRKKFALFFQPPNTKKRKAVFSFAYGEGELVDFQHKLLSFTPTLDAFDQATDFELFIIKDKTTRGTTVNFINKLTLEENKKIKAERDRRFTGGNPGPQGGKQTPVDDGVQIGFKAFGRSFKFPPHKRFKSEFAARRAIEEFVKRQKENFITGRGTLKGNEAVQSRQTHTLSGITEQFTGKYFYAQVVHRLSKSDGYKNEFTCRKLIDDTIVQSPPTLDLSANDVLVQKAKGNL